MLQCQAERRSYQTLDIEEDRNILAVVTLGAAVDLTLSAVRSSSGERAALKCRGTSDLSPRGPLRQHGERSVCLGRPRMCARLEIPTEPRVTSGWRLFEWCVHVV